ncbi:MAG TPA: hypothetical protein VF656_15255 [Pyrinomonadaceae bacterium]|jgi:hypothetical protein
MQSLSVHPTAAREEPLDAATEVARLELLLAERQAELTTLQREMHEFRARYAQVVGGRLAELAEIEQAIREAEARLHEQPDAAAQPEDSEGEGRTDVAGKSQVATSLRKLFWSVAKLFHPDHAADEEEARRRHRIMVEAGRAYREGDAESLHTLLGDEDLQLFCTRVQADDAPLGLQDKLFALKEELRTIEFGIKRITQDKLYRVKLTADAEAEQGRDALAGEAERINRQIVKARHRLTNLT